MADAKAFMDANIAKKAWLDAKTQYVKDQGRYNRNEIETYCNVWKKTKMTENHLHFLTK